MGLGQRLDDGQTKAGAAIFTIASLIDPIETVKDMCQMFHRNTDARIADRHLCLAISHSQSYLDLSSIGSIVDSIGDKIEK